ncbi:MAG: hypothetical protein WCS52_04125 [bacterium]
MNRWLVTFISVAMFSCGVALATTRYVVPPGGGHVPLSPYTSWADAATNLHAVMAVAVGGDTVLVTNGVYMLTNQIIIATNIILRSENNGTNDPLGTIINADNYAGKPVTNRCFTLSFSNAVVEGFTITNGYVLGDGGGVYISAGTLRNCLVTGNMLTNGSGGGVYATGSKSVVTNCDVIANTVFSTALGQGGGGLLLQSGAQVWNSRIMYNQSPLGNSCGGGIHSYGGAVFNSSIISNTALAGYGSGGVWVQTPATTLRNCLIMGNGKGAGSSAAGVGSHGGSATIENCTIVGNYGDGIGANNASTYNVTNTISFYNTLEAMRPSSGAAGSTNTLKAVNCCMTSTNYVAGGSGNIIGAPAFMQHASGDYRLAPWSRGVDAGLTLSWMSTAIDLAGNPRISSNTLPDMGAYETAGGPVAIHYVAQNGQTPVSPYTNGWAGAASNIQDAVSVMSDGATVWVTNGVYILTNQITVNYATLRSYNNNGVDRGTVINGNYPNTTNRCFFINHADALVEGFTITNGCAPSNDCFGGGVYMTNGILRNCLVTGNRATNNPVSGGSRGGGVYAVGSSLITNCDITANTIGNAGFGGGVYLTTPAQFWNSRILHNGTATTNDLSGGSLGGGAYIYGTGALICNSIIASNAISPKANSVNGGGVYMNDGGTLRNCLITGNSAFAGAGVAVVGNPTISDVESCTIAGNFAGYHGGLATPSGIILVARVKNVICYSNQPDNLYFSNITNALFTNSCVVSSYTLLGSGNISNNPLFENPTGSNYRLTKASPCVNAGFYQAWMTGAVDLDGKLRISPKIGGTVDMGAYEYEFQALGSLILVQ